MINLFKAIWVTVKWAVVLAIAVIALAGWGLVGFCVYAAVVGGYIFMKDTQERNKILADRLAHRLVAAWLIEPSGMRPVKWEGTRRATGILLIINSLDIAIDIAI